MTKFNAFAFMRKNYTFFLVKRTILFFFETLYLKNESSIWLIYDVYVYNENEG